MPRSQSIADGVNQNYQIISRWMHKTLTDWQIVLKIHGAKVLIYEEYIDSTTNNKHFGKFILLLSKQCPNLTHVRLLFSGEASDCLEDGFVKSLWQLPNLKCLSLFDIPNNEFFALKHELNQLTTLKLVDVDENVTVNDFSNIFDSMKSLQNFVCEYKASKNMQIVAGLSGLSNLKSLTLYYPPELELKHLKNCNQLDILHLYNIDDKLGSDDFIEIFKEKRSLQTLSICFTDSKLISQLSKLDVYCQKLTYLSVNQLSNDIGDLVNLKYLRVGTFFEAKDFLERLSIRYADRLQILDLSITPHHADSSKIIKLKSLKALLCSSWPSNMYQCLTQLEHLQLFSLEQNINNTDAILKMVENCKNLRYLRLPYKAEQSDELVLNLPNCLSTRNFQSESPFVLYLVGSDAVTDIEDKLKEHPHGRLLHLDWNGKMFASKLKDLIASLGHSDANTDDNNVFKFPGKVAGDSFGPEDSWLSSMNYKLALRACSNRFNLEYDQELIKRCRDFTISNAEYELSNMQFAFNFKYDAIDEYNIYPEKKCD